jgi:hypothetical protein
MLQRLGVTESHRASCSPRCPPAQSLRPTWRRPRRPAAAAVSQRPEELDDWETADSKEMSRKYAEFLPKGAAKHAPQWKQQIANELDPELPQRHRTPNEENIQTHTVQWYPGHIARAERQLKEQLKMVDVVMEIRDARIPVSTCHPSLASWLGQKPSLLVFNRVDMVTKSDRAAWAAHFKAAKQRVYWTDGKQGDGIRDLKADLLRVGVALNERRKARGLNPRPVRACVIGFPNIGKSAIINRLLGKRVAASAPKPGVTRILQWIRVRGPAPSRRPACLPLIPPPRLPRPLGPPAAASRRRPPASLPTARPGRPLAAACTAGGGRGPAGPAGRARHHPRRLRRPGGGAAPGRLQRHRRGRLRGLDHRGGLPDALPPAARQQPRAAAPGGALQGGRARRHSRGLCAGADAGAGEVACAGPGWARLAGTGWC